MGTTASANVRAGTPSFVTIVGKKLGTKRTTLAFCTAFYDTKSSPAPFTMVVLLPSSTTVATASVTASIDRTFGNAVSTKPSVARKGVK